MAAKYSRLQKVQTAKEQRRALMFVMLSVLLLVVFVFYVVPLVPRFTATLSDWAGREAKSTSISGNILSSPEFQDLPEYTNEEKLIAKGTAMPGSTVIINFNDTTKELIANSNGEFSSTFYLIKGENTLSASVVGVDGEVAGRSNTNTIILDNVDPLLEIIKPSDGESFFGNSSRQLSVEGQTERDASVTINDRVAIVNHEGKFSMLFNLEQGENVFKILATDEAGNKTETELKVNYSI